MTFEQKVKSMTAKEIIMAMVEGLRNPVTEIDMADFGRTNNGNCYGCAATNTICKIGGYGYEDLLKNTSGCYISREGLTNGEFVFHFENAIDNLRVDNIFAYNLISISSNFATITKPLDLFLPKLRNDYTEEDLLQYVKLAEAQN